MAISRLDRFQIVNQIKILEALYPEESEYYSRMREIFENGYEIFYEDYLANIYDGSYKMSVEECEEVFDTLEMFQAIGYFFDSNEIDDDDKRILFRKFAGYDGNNETKFMSFTEFLMDRMGRFVSVPMVKPGYWNSHMPVRDVYSRMLEVWRRLPLNKRFDLDEDQVRKIVGAAIHPENRGGSVIE